MAARGFFRFLMCEVYVLLFSACTPYFGTFAVTLIRIINSTAGALSMHHC